MLRCSRASQMVFRAGPVRKRREQSLRCWSFGRCLRCGKTGEKSVRRRCWSGWARSRERIGAGGEAGVPLVGSAGGDSRARSPAKVSRHTSSAGERPLDEMAKRLLAGRAEVG